MEKRNMVIEKDAQLMRETTIQAMPALTSSYDHLELVMKAW